jgi:outer membrane protein TolC
MSEGVAGRSTMSRRAVRVHGQAAVLTVALALAMPVALAQSGMSYAQARAALEAAPQGSAANAADLRAAAHQAAAVRNLYRPTVIGSVSALAYQKTLALDTSGAKQQVIEGVHDYLGTLGGQLPPEYSAIAALVAGRVQQALPGLLAPIPDELEYTANDRIVRPNLTAVMPLYSGGAIPAIRDAARSGVAVAQAKLESGRALDDVRLSQQYFGRQLAAQLRATAQEALAANQRHLDNTQAMQRNGVVPRVTVLEVTVLRDAAQRTLDRARSEEEVAALALARSTGAAPDVALSTPLFVNRQPLPPLAAFIAAATASPNGQTQLAQAQLDLADAGVRLARSSLKPKVNAFASYNLERKQALPVDPDWMVGVTLTMPLLTSVDRAELVAAARAREESARLQKQSAQDRVGGEIERAYALAEDARRRFLSMDSSLVAAREHLRVQEVAWREGEGTAARLLDAQAMLAAARAQRASTAYEYDVALAALLAASGQSRLYERYATRDDRMTLDDHE